MGESTKAVLALLIAISVFVGATAWLGFTSSPGTWAVRIITLVVGGLALAALLALHFRKDKAPDFLAQVSRQYFNRDGFSFCFGTRVSNNLCHLVLFYQSQFDRRSHAQVAVRPGRNFVLKRGPLESITFDVPCEPASFGAVSIPIPVPLACQGRKQKLEVGAAVHYAEGHGKRLRFRDGLFLRTNSNFGAGFRTMLTVAGAASGTLVITRPATATIELPNGVDTELPERTETTHKVLWRLGDPPDAAIWQPSDSGEMQPAA